ncbi:MAG: bis(5'-nucleosyl)-tetraphosphatase (symmetrical) YqeK [Cyanobacteria bacterium J06641_5]
MARRERILQWLAQNVPPSRLQHILGVEETALALADHHGADLCKTQWAALLHDAAKFFPPQRLLEMAHFEAMEIDPLCATYPHLLHADVSAIVARDEFGIADPEILAGIRNHTLGRSGMSVVSCIVFVADAIEPGRGDTPALDALRQICWEDLHRGVRQACDDSLQYLVRQGRPIHPRTVETRNWALSRSRKVKAPVFPGLPVPANTLN